MDLYATMQLMASDNIESYLKEAGIEIPRLRGIRYMKDETPMTEMEIEKTALANGKYYLHLFKEDVYYVNGRHIHSYDKRKCRGMARRSYKRTVKNLRMFNSFCGREDVIYVHARLGTHNWSDVTHKSFSKKKWYLGSCDEGFDDTYCDIYISMK